MKKTEISLVLTTHREQYYLWMTLKSIFAMLEELRKKKISSELILIVDNADVETKKIIDLAKDKLSRVIYCNNNDPAASRNLGIKEAKGELIAILDGDDLYSKNWLVEACEYYSRSKNKRLCLHPQFNVMFGNELYWWKHIDQDSRCFSPIDMMAVNYWQANCVFPKIMTEKVLYTLANYHAGIGYEDWAFNCDVISAGYIHKVVPATSHFIRIKNNCSRNQYAISKGLIPRQLRLFSEILEMNYPKQKTGYYSSKESRIIPHQVQEHVKDIAKVEPGISKQFANIKAVRRYEPIAMPAMFFKDYKKLTSALDTTVSFIGKYFSEEQFISLGSVIYTDELKKMHSNNFGISNSIRLSHGENINSRYFFLRSHLFLRSFFYKKVKHVNIINSLLGIKIVKRTWNVYRNNFNIVFYFTDMDENVFINEFGPEIIYLIQLGAHAENIRLSQNLYDKFMDTYSKQWAKYISVLKVEVM